MIVLVMKLLGLLLNKLKKSSKKKSSKKGKKEAVTVQAVSYPNIGFGNFDTTKTRNYFS